MNKRSGFHLSWCIAALLSSSVVHADATFKILAVKHNPTCGRRGSPHFGERCGRDFECDSAPGQGDGLCIGSIIPTNTLNVAVGDTVVAEVFVSDWSPNGESFRAYQFKFDLGSFFDCPRGITVYGWTNRRKECVWCSEDAQCLDGEVCRVTGNCYPPDHDPFVGVFIDVNDPDYPFGGFPGVIPAIDPCTLTYGAILIQPPGPVDEGAAKYLGSIVLSVLPYSAGEYEVRLQGRDDIGNPQTFLDSDGFRFVPNLEPLTLVAPGFNGDCWGCWAEYSEPPHCAIDPRQTSQPDGITLLPGSDSMAISFVNTFEDPCDLIPGVNEFTVRQFPFGDPPAISSVDWDDSTSTATINFDRRISAQKWTCVSYIGKEPHTEFCTGYLPGDVDGNGSANATDILNVIDNLNRQVDPPFPIWQCDVDRSGACGASDILRVIDLLNGADQYDIWLRATIDPCPPPG